MFRELHRAIRLEVTWHRLNEHRRGNGAPPVGRGWYARFDEQLADANEAMVRRLLVDRAKDPRPHLYLCLRRRDE